MEQRVTQCTLLVVPGSTSTCSSELGLSLELLVV